MVKESRGRLLQHPEGMKPIKGIALALCVAGSTTLLLATPAKASYKYDSNVRVCYGVDAMSAPEGARKIRLPEGLSGPDR